MINFKFCWKYIAHKAIMKSHFVNHIGWEATDEGVPYSDTYDAKGNVEEYRFLQVEWFLSCCTQLRHYVPNTFVPF